MRIRSAGGEWVYGGPQNHMYQTEHDELFASIRNGKPINNGEYMAQEHAAGDHGPHGRLHRPGDHLGDGDEIAGRPRPVSIRLGRPAPGRRDRRAGPDAIPLRRMFRRHRGEFRHDIGFNAAAVPGGDRGGGRHGRPGGWARSRQWARRSPGCAAESRGAGLGVLLPVARLPHRRPVPRRLPGVRRAPRALHRPPFEIASLFIEQVSPATDLGRAKAERHRVRLSPTIADALTLGTGKLAVDAVLLIAEHGEYPYNEKLQKLYPRGKYFREVLDVFRASGRAVPVFIDKHLSYSRAEAAAMVKAASAQKVPLMAGSSLPVTWRLPPLEIPLGRKFHEVLVASRGDLEIFGFHALETSSAWPSAATAAASRRASPR